MHSHLYPASSLGIHSCLKFKIEDDESATIMDATVMQLNAALEALVKAKPLLSTATLLLKVRKKGSN